MGTDRILTAIDVICPWCHAAVGAACTEKKKDQPEGFCDIRIFHPQRVVKAQAGDTSCPPLREQEWDSTRILIRRQQEREDQWLQQDHLNKDADALPTS
jgi:hypothetical protein